MHPFNDLTALLQENNVRTEMKGDVLVVHTKDVEYRIYYQGDDGLYIGTVKPMYATGELFSEHIDILSIMDMLIKI